MKVSSCEQAAAPVQAKQSRTNRILLAEDDQMLSEFLLNLLVGEGYEVEIACNGPSVLAKVDDDLNLLLLDLNLPELDGLSVLHQLRPRFAQLSILVLTARNRSEGLLPALDNGADDCLLKPFSYLELLARIRVLLRRHAPVLESTSQCADLVLHRKHVSVKRGARRIDLTQREFALLEYLMRTPEIPVSRATLLKELWGTACEPSTNVVDVYMKYVRDKVDLPGLPRLVRTVRGTGYMVSATC